ncbi:hypothetical protein A3A21_03360 [Candidatus Jorgensenbacteria bacterium RIFCSPLOWO2_01_FULL_45_25b]|uniref:RCK N-terminal domain-containing protein n=1 Tax=Candidatus Jorgensenbacteria bacterium RIFCSPLOWO2_01_FULL_45_25b TaxID=1798471 RepID=A0A1F6BYQ2_9BACT|nr:MAG: hypothetical protein A3A21_03360 [Candidatus Jorgensenbacteria bacterium RIFCSPLOWO2_01_FULL_45_25b]
MDSGLFDLGIVFVLAAALGIGARLLKQPLILAYLAAGALIAYFNVFHIGEKDVFLVFSKLGVMFLLFLIGLEINYSALRVIGRVSLILGLSQIVITAGLGYLIAYFFGFAFLPALYIAIALAFSSTIIVLKLLSEKREEHSLYGRISIGFLLVQDFVAILLLVVLAGAQQSGGFSFWRMLLTIIEGAALFSAMLFLGRRVFPALFNVIARSHELLFLVSLAWMFLMVSFVQRLGFSIEIGGFLAGLALANSSENFQIAGRVRPLRDFFILVFFVILGSSLLAANISGIILPVVVFSLFVLVGNPLIVLIIMAILGYRKRTSFFTGLTVAQISEFSLILIALGLQMGHIDERVSALVTAVAVITITLSTYLMLYADKFFLYLLPFLSFFERKRLTEKDAPGGISKSVVLVGCHRIGQSIAFSLPKEELLVVDFDPDIAHEMKKHGFDYLMGDISDPETFDRIDMTDVCLFISTSPNLEDNLAILSFFRSFSSRPRTVLRAESEEDAEVLYKEGADYVILPHFTAGQYFGKTILVDPEMKILDQLRERDLALLRRVRAGTS